MTDIEILAAIDLDTLPTASAAVVAAMLAQRWAAEVWRAQVAECAARGDA